MEVIPSRLENANDFKEGLALIEDRENHKYGYINKQGKIVIPCIYDKADDFSNGMATVMLDGIEFYIDKNNKPLQFNETKQKIIEVKAPNKIPTYVQDFNCERDFMAYKTKLIVSDDWEPQVVVTRNINDYENHLNKVITKQIIIEKSMQDLGNKKILTK